MLSVAYVSRMCFVRCLVSLNFRSTGFWTCSAKRTPYPVSTLGLRVGTFASSHSFPWVSICTNRSDHLSSDRYSKRSMRFLRSILSKGLNVEVQHMECDDQQWENVSLCILTYEVLSAMTNAVMRTDNGADCDSSRWSSRTNRKRNLSHLNGETSGSIVA